MPAVPADIMPIKLPLSIANGTKDFHITPLLMEQVKDIFANKDNCELEDQAVAWFTKWFGKVGGPKL